MITRAVVTGGAGFIGANLVDRLVDDGAEVLVVDDLSRGKLERLSEARRNGHVQIHQMDVRADELTELLDRYEPQTVFHLAAQVEVRRSVLEPMADASANIMGSINVLSAAAASGAERVVFTSSAARFGEPDQIPTPENAPTRPQSPYGVSKLAVDAYLRYFQDTHGLEFVSLGLSNVFGPRQDPRGEAGVVAIFAHHLLSGRRPVIFGDGSQRRDYVFVEDVTDACVRAAELGGNRYLNIGTGVETSLNELLALLQSVAGTQAAPRYEAAMPGDPQRSCLDPAAAREHLGWEPWTSLEDGLAHTVDWFRSRR